MPSISTTSVLLKESEKAPIPVKEILTTEQEIAQRGHPEGVVTIQEPVSTLLTANVVCVMSAKHGNSV